jgi:predicted O-linked N-acetylglucosamine transferase (SPINDLY family)
LRPQLVEAHFNLGTAWMQKKDFPRSIACFQKAIAVQPGFAGAHMNLGNAYLAVKHFDLAVASYKNFITLRPNDPDAHRNLGAALRGQRQLDLAIECFQRARALNPQSIEAHVDLGSAWAAKGNPDHAIASFRRALDLHPSCVEALIGLGAAYSGNGDLDRGIEFHRRALELHPNSAEACNNLGLTLHQKGDFAAAIECFRRALSINPDLAEALNNLGMALTDAGDATRAIECYRRALSRRPDWVVALSNLGHALCRAALYDDGIAAYQRALSLDPDFAHALNGLGMAYNDLSQTGPAIEALEKAVALKPDFAEAYSNLGNSWKDAGQIDQALACYRKSIELKPSFASAHDNLLYVLSFHPDSTRASMHAEFVNWNRVHAQGFKQFIRPHPNDRDPGRRLRIGYLSPDFRRHPVGRFLRPLLAAHDHNVVEVYCYAHVPLPDQLTATLQSHADHWRNIVPLSNAEAADLIRQDKIDILVDLTMHLGENRLPIFAHKPAPVQVTYLAYAGGTALDTIDYRLTDRHLDPDEADDRYYLEKSIRLPGTYWCYDQTMTAEPVREPPAIGQRFITFGCLNTFSKVSDPALHTWGNLLGRIPTARLLIHMNSGGDRDRVLRILGNHGVAAERIEIIGRVAPEEYFKTYHRIDIGLDSFPYTGGTTTCDSLWMGVPVVTLAGRTAVARAGVSILSNAGLPELIAQTPEEYVQIAAGLANDLSRLRPLRSSLRAQIQQSPLMDGPRFACDIEAAYRTMWQTWCESAPAK